MAECSWTENKIIVTTNPPVSGANIRYGNDELGIEETETDLLGKAEFCYIKGLAVYISIQKTNHVFSDELIVLSSTGEPSTKQSWGASSPWVKVYNPFIGFTPPKPMYSLKKPVEVEEIVEEVVEEVEEVIDEVCQTEASPTVPATLSTYFSISIRDAKWICNGKTEMINNKNAIIKVKGHEVAQIPIRNGYGSPINIGNMRKFKELVG